MTSTQTLNHTNVAMFPIVFVRVTSEACLTAGNPPSDLVVDPASTATKELVQVRKRSTRFERFSLGVHVVGIVVVVVEIWIVLGH